MAGCTTALVTVTVAHWTGLLKTEKGEAKSIQDHLQTPSVKA